ncbi:MAG: hypothetical protein JW991_04160 [Candidatus Pacebacteria bacterium]|nr:hypothetical protein [Candidatus Paceibacterota bacterium]
MILFVDLWENVFEKAVLSLFVNLILIILFLYLLPALLAFLFSHLISPWSNKKTRLLLTTFFILLAMLITLTVGVYKDENNFILKLSAGILEAD